MGAYFVPFLRARADPGSGGILILIQLPAIVYRPVVVLQFFSATATGRLDPAPAASPAGPRGRFRSASPCCAYWRLRRSGGYLGDEPEPNSGASC
jgi:hypothetical protein